MDKPSIRRANLQKLVNHHLAQGLKQADIAKKFGKNPNYFSDVLNGTINPKTGKPKSFGEKTAREMERRARIPDGMLDEPLAGITDIVAALSPSELSPEWPFDVPFEDFDRLPLHEKAEIQGIIKEKVRAHQAKSAPRRRKMPK